jgi:hypothetical protein
MIPAIIVISIVVLFSYICSKPFNREDKPVEPVQDDRPDYVKDLENKLDEKGVESERDLL